ncbi:ABC transporter G family member 20 [Bombyx mori]|uniref:ABC transporter domain-containing protein n=1 Tax=Bombyx mori TaxID=7091 RepID=A0A8R2C9F1_BOMMO|nr:ABC transporter G family member 20 [Bombyx mori]
MAVREAAVIVECANKSYGQQNVLNDLDLTVEKGTIYGLLGPSGCGKTTLLSCIVGRRSLDSGNVWVLGGKPGEKGSGVPGPRVGYMPQDIALVGEFTVRDAVYYFGRIYGMEHKKMTERFEFLSSLLDLPSGNRLIKNCSGGQQRRVSLAAALVHDPELLILDEPTVGLDPVLREQIWKFLTDVAQQGTTVIITTHYIDETKQAHKIGLLRDGQLLAEDSPDEILRKFECNTLEEAFLKLALAQYEIPQRRPPPTVSPDVIPESRQIESVYESRETFNAVNGSTDVLTKKEKSIRSRNLSRSRYKAVFIKCIQQFCRHPGGLIFSILFPIIEVVAFFLAVGHDPRDLQIAVVNEEAVFSPFGLDICRRSDLQTTKLLKDGTCELYMLGCWFLEEMENKELVQTVYNSTEEAKSAVATGKLYAALHFAQNFSEALGLRVAEGEVADRTLAESNIRVWLDMTNHQISYFIKQQLHKAYESFTKRVMRACDRPENIIQIPVNFHDPIYGKKEPEMVGYMAPGILITIIFFLPSVVTSTLMIGDRLEGVWERSAVAGVRPREMLNVHIALQSVVIVVQTIEMMVLAFAGYGIPSRGSNITCGILLFLQGLSGMCYGFLLSVYCTSHTMAFFVATGSFYPMILLCGILWPLEGMSGGLRYFALALPFTIPSNSLRDMFEKGASITDSTVYNGFLVTFLWIFITLGLILLRLKYKKT